MTNLIDRLRDTADAFELAHAPAHLTLMMRAASDEIERLRDSNNEQRNSIEFLRSEIDKLTKAFAVRALGGSDE